MGKCSILFDSILYKFPYHVLNYMCTMYNLQFENCSIIELRDCGIFLGF